MNDENHTPTPSDSPSTSTKKPSLTGQLWRVSKRVAVPLGCIGIGVLASMLHSTRR